MALPIVESATTDRDKVVALSLMRMAHALLSRDGISLAAARLQHAIDTVEENRAEP